MPDKKVKLSDREHPSYTEYKDIWDFYFDAVMGGSNFINSDYLFSHRLEDDTDFQDRLERSYYLNFCDAIPNMYNTFIFREIVERPPNIDLEFFRRNIDKKGTKIQDFVKLCGYLASIYGVIHCLVDIPTVTEKKIITREDDKNGLTTPMCKIIYPSQIVDWSEDANGNLRWIIIKYTYLRDEDPTVERTEEIHYKLITTEEWRIEDEDGNPVKLPDADSKGPNTFGFIPLVTMFHKNIDDNMIGESLIRDIAYINRTLLNWCSCIDEMIERQTFSQLIIPDDGSMGQEDESGVDPLDDVGTGVAFTFPHDSTHTPKFISPDTTGIKTVWSLVMDHIKEMYRLGGLSGGVGDLYASKSGRAAQVGFTSVNSALSDKAAKYEKFENDISKTALILMNKDASSYDAVKYPSSFDVSALSDELDSNFKIIRANFSETLNKGLMKNISRKALPLASEIMRKDIESEIESGDGTITGFEIGGNNDDDESAVGEGNPNVNNLSDTTRTSQDLEDDEKKKKKKDK